MSTADELRRAAELLRQRAQAATDGPWVVDCGQEIHSATDYGPWVAETCQHDNPAATRANSAYIATVHPGVGLALADWLDDEATYPTGALAAAMSVAQAILREVPAVTE